MKRTTRKLHKVLLTLCCALALVAISVGATLAYLTDTDTVKNTFTVGNVDITLDEAPVNEDGAATEGDRVQKNEYHLIPGKTYDKDPTVHVQANSEPCYVFVKVENGLADIEDPENTIADQILALGWEPLDDVPNVYYTVQETSTAVVDHIVFGNFTLMGDGLLTGEQPDDYAGTDKFLGDYADATIKITAYAIQKSGFEKAEDAWAAGNWN